MIGVFLVEDQTIVREGLRTLLDLVDDIEVIGEAIDGQQAVTSIPDLVPDVVLLDLRMPRLTNAIRTVADGGTMIQPAVTDRVLKGLEGIQPEFESLDPPDPLTERETEILRLIAVGYSNKEIAQAFDLAAGTVKNHISSILSKLGVRDRTRAVLKAVELGYIS